MTDQYLVKALQGSKIIPQGTNIYIQLKDGSFAPVPVEKAANVYPGKTKLVYLTNKLNMDSSELEQKLMNIKDGYFSTYRKATMQLHEQQGTSYIPKLAACLQEAIPKHAQKEGLDKLHELVEKYAHSNGFETVSREQFNNWYKGADVAPRDWRNFAAIASASKISSALSSLTEFYADYLAFNPEKKSTTDAEENKYSAYLWWLGLKISMGLKTKSGFKPNANHNSGSSAGSGNSGGRSTDFMNKFIEEHLCQYIDQDHCAVPLLEISKIETKKNNKNIQTKTEVPDPAYNGIYVVKSESNGLNLKKKTSKEAMKDAILLERILFNQIFSAVYDVGKSRNAGEIDRTDFLTKVFASYYNIEEKVRPCKVEREAFGLTPEQRKFSDSVSDETYRALFESQEGNKLLGLEKNSIQNLRDARDLTVPIFPDTIERNVLASWSLSLLENMLIPGEKSKMQSREDKIRNYKKIFMETHEKAVSLQREYDLKKIATEQFPGYVFLKKMNQLESEPQYCGLVEKMKTNDYLKTLPVILTVQNGVNLVDEPFYEEQDFVNVLNAYGLEEFIEKDFDIALWRKIKPSVSTKSS